jgi:PAS domain-containing protein
MSIDLTSRVKLLSEQLRREHAAREAAEETLERISLELTRSNKKLKEAALKHKALLQAIDEFEGSVIVIDQDEMCTYASEKTNAILGLSPDILLNRPLDSMGENMLNDQLSIAKKKWFEINRPLGIRTGCTCGPTMPFGVPVLFKRRSWNSYCRRGRYEKRFSKTCVQSDPRRTEAPRQRFTT